MSKYTTSQNGCSCPDYNYRRRPRGESCKHMKELKRMATNQEIMDQLTAPLPPEAVKYRPGGYSQLPYLSADYIIDQANRIFGFDGWEYEIVGDIQEIIIPNPPKRVDQTTGEILPPLDRGFRATVKVTVTAFESGPKVRAAVGFRPIAGHSIENFETAIKGAESDGLKRAFRGFGEQFGNGLPKIARIHKQAAQGTPAQQPAAPAQNKPSRPRAAQTAKKPAEPSTNTTPTQERPAAPVSVPGKGMVCEEHQKPLGKTPSGHMGHPLPGKDQWCLTTIPGLDDDSDVVGAGTKAEPAGAKTSPFD